LSFSCIVLLYHRGSTVMSGRRRHASSVVDPLCQPEARLRRPHRAATLRCHVRTRGFQRASANSVAYVVSVRTSNCREVETARATRRPLDPTGASFVGRNARQVRRALPCDDAVTLYDTRRSRTGASTTHDQREAGERLGCAPLRRYLEGKSGRRTREG
jgi:hypothetical protein